ncbi:MAG TPA: vitamin B12 dependent-methionine synthase activation domain-containing protein [Methylomirabilota bacterium]|nr:vitamin B12 dependent-methionine synthase activation domain-containing protein [Methylomirabilota bacterium]
MTEALRVLTTVPVALEGLPLRIDRDEVLRFQGYKKGVDIPTADVIALFDEALALGERLMIPRVVYRAVPVNRQAPDVIEASDQALHIPEIERLWGRLEAVGAGICTVGLAIEERVRVLFDAREFPLAVMLDSVGSAAAESLAEYANDLLCQVALAEGLKVTNRISPGYAGWDTAEQAELFRLCPGEPIGVTLNSACFMTPAKSISFLVGVGPQARVDHYFVQCRRCWMRDCAYRRVPAAATVHR